MSVEKEVEFPFVSPFGDGTAAQQTVDIVKKNFA